MYSNIMIRKAKESDVKRIKKLSDLYIGEDFYTYDDLYKIISNEQHLLYVYTQDNNIIAFLYFIKTTLIEAGTILNIPGENDLYNLYDNNISVCIFKTTCMDIEFRKKGLMTEFLSNVLYDIEKLDVSIYIALAIKSNESSDNVLNIYNKDEPGIKLLKNIGFKEFQLIEKPWNKLHFYCPYCKNNHCICNGMIYIKNKIIEEG